jgi:hypothetical protein
MSLILDALKKLDREKAFIRKVTTNIADEILKTDPDRSGKKFWFYFTAVSFTAVAAAGITYGVMAGFGLLSKATPPAPMNPARVSPQVESAPIAREPVQEAPVVTSRVSPKVRDDVESKKPSLQDSSPGASVTAGKQASQQAESVPIAREPRREAQEGVNLAVPKASGNVESKRPSGSPADKKAEPKVAPGETIVPAGNAKTTTQSAVSESESATPSLRLSGIVWSEAPSERYAVINGAIISEGALIQGVKVEEIFPNRVRLSHKGRSFEIRLF